MRTWHNGKTNRLGAHTEKKRVTVKFHVPHLHANGSIYDHAEENNRSEVDKYPQQNYGHPHRQEQSNWATLLNTSITDRLND